MSKFTRNATLVISLISAGLIFASSALAVNYPPQASTAKLKMCQAKENGIKQRSSHLSQMVSTMEEKFDKIATKVEGYYNSKVVPSGKTVSNYNSLVSEIQSKKATVSTALTKAQTDAAAFSCTADDPKGQLTQFRVDMQAAKSALKDYRISIKNLIVAVHSIVGETNKSKEASPTGGNK